MQGKGKHKVGLRAGELGGDGGATVIVQRNADNAATGLTIGWLRVSG